MPPTRFGFWQALKRRFGADTRESTYYDQVPQATLRTPSSRGLFGSRIDDREFLFAVQREPAAFRIVYGVARDTLDNWFTIAPAEGDDDGSLNTAVRANVHLLKRTLSPRFVEDVKSGARRDVSVGFTYDTEEQPGEWNGEKYDFIQRNLLINHVAVGVPVGRVRAPFIGLGVDNLEFEDTADLVPAQTPAPPAPPAQLTQTPTEPAPPKPANPAQNSTIEVTLTPTNEKTGSLISKVRGLAHL